MFNSLHSKINQELHKKQLCNQNSHYEKQKWCAPPPPVKGSASINYRLKREVSIMLRCQLCSTRYTAVQIRNYSKSTSVIKIATMENTDDFRYAKEAITWYHQVNTFHCQQR